MSHSVIPFADYCARVQRRIEHAYAIRVVTCDVPDPLIGDLDGAAIYIDYTVEGETRLFLLAHLFGHTVQWNVNPDALETGKLHKPPVPRESLPAILAYEWEAACLGLALLHEAGIAGIDAWYADYTASDVAYLTHYYETGERLEFATFRQSGTPLLEARPIPPFTPVRKRLRAGGLVL